MPRKPVKRVIENLYCKKCKQIITPKSAVREGGICLRCKIESEDELLLNKKM